MHAARARSRLGVAMAALSFTLGACGSRAAPGPDDSPTTSNATIPAQGDTATLDFGTWNLEWFGDTGHGPSDEQLQLQNVRDVIGGADLDVWGVQEVVDVAHFDDLVGQLSGYAGLLANDPSVVDGPAYYSGFNDTEQKVGIIYKTSIATVKSARIILTSYDYAFAGRPPMEVVLTVSLNGTTRDIVLIVLHAKSGASSDDWNRRDQAAAALESYLDTSYPTAEVWVLGDFNDDVDTSIVNGNPSPYEEFNTDPDYTFPTRELSLAGESASIHYPDIIDHHLNTDEVYALYVPSSARVLYADNYISDYGATTSDHRPVLSRYTWDLGDGSTSVSAALR